MMRGGRVFGLLMPGHHINGSEFSSLPIMATPTTGETVGPSLSSSGGENLRTQIALLVGRDLPIPDSLLPTPIVSDGTGGSKDINTSDFSPQMRDIGKLLPTPTVSDNTGAAASEVAAGNPHDRLKVEVKLFPTPNTMDHLPARTAEQKAANSAKGGYANVGETVINDLIPTPTTRDHKDGLLPHERGGVIQTDTVARAVFNSGEVHGTNWGKFEPAIRRWEETVGRKAPAPTKPDGKDGAHRLSSEFTEWMMGLDEGWITGVGLSRNDELKACGNGVVPQQALLALHSLLDGVRIET
jgi:hypothetical protein